MAPATSPRSSRIGMRVTTKVWSRASKISRRIGLPVATTWRMRLLGRKVSISRPSTSAGATPRLAA